MRSLRKRPELGHFLATTGQLLLDFDLYLRYISGMRKYKSSCNAYSKLRW
jgi:hypothetical protein